MIVLLADFLRICNVVERLSCRINYVYHTKRKLGFKSNRLLYTVSFTFLANKLVIIVTILVKFSHLQYMYIIFVTQTLRLGLTWFEVNLRT